MNCLNVVKLVFILILYSVQCYTQNEIEVIVDVPELGQIKGLQINNTYGVIREYVKFLGIPYAKSPINETRFVSAEETGRLVEIGQVFDATMIGESCVQPGEFSFYNKETHSLSLEYAISGDESIPQEYYAKREGRRDNTKAYLGNEDCLNLNIHTLDVNKTLPVIIFIHGGAFTSGNGDFYGPGKLFRHDIVLVTINYRLGVLGFFSLETDEIPGNAALYDMLSALRWVQNYIKYFGGNPDLVTVMGQSAGGAGISHLILSPLSLIPKPLFHRAIAISASALLPWSTIDSPLPASYRIAELAGCYDPNVANPDPIPEITLCMKYVDPDKLVIALNIYQAEERKAGRLGVDAISPVIQKAGEFKVIEKNPIDILINGEQMDVPLIMGAVRHEGSFPFGMVYNRFLNCPDCGSLQNNATFLKKQLIPTLLRSMGVLDDNGAVYDALADKYLGDRRNSGNFTVMTPGLTDIHSVFFFKAGSYKNLELHSQKTSKSYWYTFDHKGQHSMFPFLFPGSLPPIPGGIAHGDDLLYLFHLFTLNEVDQKVSDNMVDYYVNFVYNGDPNIAHTRIGKSIPESNELIEWPTFDREGQEYLIIDKELSIGNDYMLSWSDASIELEPTPPTLAPVPTTVNTEKTTENNGASFSSQLIVIILSYLLIMIDYTIHKFV